jgi:hypothetical protein
MSQENFVEGNFYHLNEWTWFNDLLLLADSSSETIEFLQKSRNVDVDDVSDLNTFNLFNFNLSILI